MFSTIKSVKYIAPAIAKIDTIKSFKLKGNLSLVLLKEYSNMSMLIKTNIILNIIFMFLSVYILI